MVVTTRGNDEANMDAIRASIEVLVTRMNDMEDRLNERMNGMFNQQQIIHDDFRRLQHNNNVGNRGALTRLTRLDFPRFHGEDVKEWVYRSTQFFSVDDIPDEEKIKVASIHMSGKALSWHQQFVRLHGADVEWAVYEAAIVKRFGSTVEDPLSELKNLRHTSSVQLYQDEFERLLNKVEVTEKNAISLFLGGLQQEIELSVRMFKPRTLEDAFCLAKLQEDMLAATRKKSSALLPTPRSNTSSYTSYTPATVPPVTQQLTLPPVTHYSNKRTENTNAPIRRQLSLTEYEEKRAKNLCFYCDQSYTPGHKCTGQLFVIELLADDYSTEQINDSDDDSTIIVTAGHVPEQPQISMNALTGTTAHQTMRVIGQVNNQNIHILIDSGSTHTFVDEDAAKRLGCRTRTGNSMKVFIPGGNKLVSATECKNFRWTLAEIEFVSDVFILPVGGCDMVLGIQWLKTLGDIMWNFDRLQMLFKYKGKKVQLRGTKKSDAQWLEGKHRAQTTLKEGVG